MLTRVFSIFLCLAMLVPQIQAQILVKREVEIGQIHTVILAVPGRLTISQAANEGLEVIAPQKILDQLSIKGAKDVLYLAAKKNRSSVSLPKSVYHTVRYNLVVSDLKKLALIGSADIVAPAKLSGDSLELSIKGGGDLHFESLAYKNLTTTIAGAADMTINTLVGDKATIQINGAGDVNILDGELKEQGIEINGAGDFNSEKLKTALTLIDIKGAGDVKVWAVESLDVNIKGAGNVGYFGDPELKKNVRGAGAIQPLGMRDEH